MRYALAAVNGQLSTGANATDMRERVARAVEIKARARSNWVRSEVEASLKNTLKKNTHLSHIVANATLALRRRPGARHRHLPTVRAPGLLRRTSLQVVREHPQFGADGFRGGALASSRTKLSTATSVASHPYDVQRHRRLRDAVDEPVRHEGQYKMPLIQIDEYPSIVDPQVC